MMYTMYVTFTIVFQIYSYYFLQGFGGNKNKNDNNEGGHLYPLKTIIVVVVVVEWWICEIKNGNIVFFFFSVIMLFFMSQISSPVYQKYKLFLFFIS